MRHGRRRTCRQLARCAIGSAPRARCRCPDIDCHCVYARDISIPPPSPRSSPILGFMSERCRTNGAPSASRTHTRACITRVERSYIYEMRFSSLSPPIPPTLPPSLRLPEYAHARVTLRDVQRCNANCNTASIIIAIAETMQQPRGGGRAASRRNGTRRRGGGGGRSIRYRTTHLDISPGLRLRDARLLSREPISAGIRARARASEHEMRGPISLYLVRS